MLYKDIIKTLTDEKGKDLQMLAVEVGMKPNTLYQRLKESRNPRIKDMQPILDALGYEIAFVPKGEVSINKHFSECFVPEFPDKPARAASKNSEK